MSVVIPAGSVMTNDCYIRCTLFATLLASGAWSAQSAQDASRVSNAQRISPAVVFASATTRAEATMPGLTARAPRPLEPFVLSQELRDSIVVIALAQLGTPYVFGGTTPRAGFDCSGLVRFAMAQVHVAIPRTALQQSEIGEPVERNELQRGDLVAFGEDGRVTHIGLYVGDGRFVHASSVAGKVVLSALDRRPSRLIRPLQGARRLLATSVASAGARRGG
jgi:cell wall-associated NlpC family hydrolase